MPPTNAGNVRVGTISIRTGHAPGEDPSMVLSWGLRLLSPAATRKGMHRRLPAATFDLGQLGLLTKSTTSKTSRALNFRAVLLGSPPRLLLGATGTAGFRRFRRSHLKLGRRSERSEDVMRVLAMSMLVCALVPELSATAEARKLQSCLEFKDMMKPRLDCYDAIVPPQTKTEPVPAKVVTDCRFLKDDDERLICFNRFVEKPAKPTAPKATGTDPTAPAAPLTGSK
jgi:hypothetical protein